MIPSAAEEGELRISDENEIRGNAAQKQCKVTTRVLKSSTAARQMLRVVQQGADLKRGDSGDELMPRGWLVGPALLGSTSEGTSWGAHGATASWLHSHPVLLLLKPYIPACLHNKWLTVTSLWGHPTSTLCQGRKASNLSDSQQEGDRLQSQEIR